VQLNSITTNERWESFLRLAKKFHARQISLNFVARGQKVSRFLRGMTAA
jgi:hypothetical protein